MDGWMDRQSRYIASFIPRSDGRQFGARIRWTTLCRSRRQCPSILVVLVLVLPGITQCCDEVNTLLIVAHASLFWFEGRVADHWMVP